MAEVKPAGTEQPLNITLPTQTLGLTQMWQANQAQKQALDDFIANPTEALQLPVPEDAQIDPLMAIGAGLRSIGGDSGSLDFLIGEKRRMADVQRDIQAKNMVLAAEHQRNQTQDIMGALEDQIANAGRTLQIAEASNPPEAEIDWSDTNAANRAVDSILTGSTLEAAFNNQVMKAGLVEMGIEDPQDQWDYLQSKKADLMAKGLADERRTRGLKTTDEMLQRYSGDIKADIDTIASGIEMGPDGDPIQLSDKGVDDALQNIAQRMMLLDMDSAGAEMFFGRVEQMLMEAFESKRVSDTDFDQPKMKKLVGDLVARLRAPA
ncbi:MAG: hypothetical protein DRP64_15205, partial [Verrucomicrobia bacterium]